MTTAVMTSHDCLKNRLPADAFRPPPPAKFGRNARRRRDLTGPPGRRTNLSGNSAASPGHREPPSQTKPFRGNDSGRLAPGRLGQRSGTPENPNQMVVKLPVKKLVMGEVTILKRGQEARAPPQVAGGQQPVDLEQKAATATGGDDPALYSTSWLGPEPDIPPKLIRIMDPIPRHYAGSGFFTSPPPSSLPLPTSFFTKKDAANTTDLATSALRCLLRLDMP